MGTPLERRRRSSSGTQSYLAHLFYKQSSSSGKASMCFGITLPSSRDYLLAHYKDWCHSHEQTIQFQTEQENGVQVDRPTVCLSLLEQEVIIDDCWRILPLCSPKVTLEQVRQYVHQYSSPPVCKFQLECTKLGKLPPLEFRVELTGAKEPFDYLVVTFDPASLQTSDSELRRVKETLQKNLTLLAEKESCILQLQQELQAKNALLDERNKCIAQIEEKLKASAAQQEEQRLQIVQLEATLKHPTRPEVKEDVDCDIVLRGPIPESELELSWIMNKIGVNAADKWEEIACELSLKPSLITQIQHNHKTDILRFKDVMIEWKNRQTKPYTWVTLKQTLKAPQVGLNEIANNLFS